METLWKERKTQWLANFSSFQLVAFPAIDNCLSFSSLEPGVSLLSLSHNRLRELPKDCPSLKKLKAIDLSFNPIAETAFLDEKETENKKKETEGIEKNEEQVESDRKAKDECNSAHERRDKESEERINDSAFVLAETVVDRPPSIDENERSRLLLLSLETLCLDFCALSSLTEAIAMKLPSLTRLSLRNNRLRSIEAAFFESANHLKELVRSFL